MATRTTLASGWHFSQRPSANIPEVEEDWSACKVPTSVQVELKRLGRIPDPFKDLYEWDIQWIGEADWAFKTTFHVTEEQLAQPESDLVFDGLDTYCDISLNGHHLASTSNMFQHHRFACKPHLKASGNELVLHFRAPYTEAKKEEQANGGPRTLWNGTSERAYSRKAQYGWGWDWGPIVMTVGPWRPIHLDSYTLRLSDVRVDTSLRPPYYETATLQVSLGVTPKRPSSTTGDYRLQVALRAKSGELVRTDACAWTDKPIDWTFENGEVQGWWPVGYGKQPLYDLELVLLDRNGTILDTSHTRVAFRTARVVQEPLIDQPGTTFLFEINGTRVFCGGSNWIPADSFLTEIEPDRYRKWVELMVKGNQNMLRVWGGGIYEHEALYEACDELGVLVWQDFMFGCALYPSYPALNDSIQLEAEQAVERLRNHPSVVIFAGNNEDYQVAEAEGVIDYSDESGDYMHSKFPARHIYEILLPSVVSRLAPHIHYHRSSPYGGKTTRDPTIGDIHQWNVWHGTQEPWSAWPSLSGRFVSEFGMQGYPNIRTVRQWFSSPNPEEGRSWHPQSRISCQHNKADGFERRLELYLMENFRHGFSMEDYTYYTQVMQAECLGAAYRSWRREWKGPGREYVAGALVWQLNDCWPCVSWAIADYYLRPKPAYFAIKRELAPLTVGMSRRDVKTFKKGVETTALFEIAEEVQVWCCNSTVLPVAGKVEVRAWDLDKGEEVGRAEWEVVLAENRSTEVFKGIVPGQPTRTSDAQVPRPIVLHARLLDSAGIVVARYSSWPEPYKFLNFPEPALTVRAVGDDDHVRLSCVQPVKAVVLDVDDGGEDEVEVEWGDQCVDLFPGDDQVVSAKSLRGREVRVRYLGQGGT